MNKYTGLSDFEINLKIAHIVLGKDNYDWCPHSKIVKKYVTDDKGLCMDYDPCNNPSDAMPIFIENKIDLTHLVGNTVCAKHKEYWRISKKPYRAGCEVFLMMKDAEN